MNDLYVRYIELGGNADRAHFAAHLDGAADLDLHQQDILVHALNDWAADLGLGARRLPYPSEWAA